MPTFFRALVATLLIATPCFGWGASGHRVVGAIAAARLNSEAQAAVADLLGSETLADVSTWADEIRSDPTFNWARPLHYVNVPRDEETVDLARDCPAEGCVLSAIETYTQVLRDAASTATRRSRR